MIAAEEYVAYRTRLGDGKPYDVGKVLYAGRRQLLVWSHGSYRGLANARLQPEYHDPEDNRSFFSSRKPPSRCTATTISVDICQVLSHRGSFHLTTTGTVPDAVQKELANDGFTPRNHIHMDVDDDATVPFDCAVHDDRLIAFRTACEHLHHVDGFDLDVLASIVEEVCYTYN